jgi:hypothetical protein
MMKTMTLKVKEEATTTVVVERKLTFPRYGHWSTGGDHGDLECWYRVAEDGETVYVTLTEYDTVEWEIETKPARLWLRENGGPFNDESIAIGKYESTEKAFYAALDRMTKVVLGVARPVLS